MSISSSPGRAAALLDAYYAAELGCARAALTAPARRTIVVACERRATSLGLRVSPLLALVRAGGDSVASTAPRHADAVREALAGTGPPARAEDAATQVAVTIPPSCSPTTPGARRPLARAHRGPGHASRAPGAVVRRDAVGRRFWALTRSEQPAAVADVTWYTPTVANIAVETWPRFRRTSFGRAAVAEAVRAVGDREGAPPYVHRADNAASAALARSLGPENDGWVVEVTALDLPEEDAARVPPESPGAVVARAVFERGTRAAHWRLVYAQQDLLDSDGVARAAEAMCRVLAAPGRLTVLRALMRAWGAAHVEDLAAACGLDAEAVRDHCRALEAAGLACDHLGGVFSVWPHQVSTVMGLLAAAARAGERG